MSNDPTSIIVRSGLKTITIEKKKIEDVFDLTHKLSVSAGIGLNFLSSELSADYYPGIDFQFSLNNLVTDHFATRGSFEFAHNPVKNGSGYSRWTPPPDDLSMYSFKFDVLLGELRYMSMSNVYAIVGAGFTNVTQKNKSSAYLPLEFGAGFGYKISDRVRLFGEGQYGFNFFAGAFDGVLYRNILYLSVRIGAQVGLW